MRDKVSIRSGTRPRCGHLQCAGLCPCPERAGLAKTRRAGTGRRRGGAGPEGSESRGRDAETLAYGRSMVRIFKRLQLIEFEAPTSTHEGGRTHHSRLRGSPRSNHHDS